MKYFDIADLNGGRSVDFQLGHLDHRLPLTPVHEAALRIDGDGARMRYADQHPSFGGGGIELGHADDPPAFIRPVNVGTHPVDGQSLTGVESLFQNDFTRRSVEFLTLYRQSVHFSELVHRLVVMQRQNLQLTSPLRNNWIIIITSLSFSFKLLNNELVIAMIGWMNNLNRSEK